MVPVDIVPLDDVSPGDRILWNVHPHSYASLQEKEFMRFVGFNKRDIVFDAPSGTRMVMPAHLVNNALVKWIKP